MSKTKSEYQFLFNVSKTYKDDLKSLASKYTEVQKTAKSVIEKRFDTEKKKHLVVN